VNTSKLTIIYQSAWCNKEVPTTGQEIRTEGMVVSNLLATESHPVQYVAHCLSLWTP